MSYKVELGGERLGGGKKNSVTLHEYERSTHDLTRVWKSTMGSGTIVPFFKELALPGDTWEINLHPRVLTMPTIGPLFGTYTIQMDMFLCPIRLYQADLHMNLTEIGLDMSKILLPQMEVKGANFMPTMPLETAQINPSCILKYLGISGIGIDQSQSNRVVKRKFNAIPLLSYWDIYKQYYSNKQEKRGAVVHQDAQPTIVTPLIATLTQAYNTDPAGLIPITGTTLATRRLNEDSYIQIQVTAITLTTNPSIFRMYTTLGNKSLTEIFNSWTIDTQSKLITFYDPKGNWVVMTNQGWQLGPINIAADLAGNPIKSDTPPIVRFFDLKNIDTMKKRILQAPDNTAFLIDKNVGLEPYSWILQEYINGPDSSFSAVFPAEGLGIKTYKSDMFQNWLDTEWITGTTGINNVTAVDTTGNKFTIPALMLNKKIYDLLMRVAVSGGTYDDWLDAVYTHDRQKTAESPIYLGGMIRNVVFDAVVGLAASADQPLGTLAGRGMIGGMDKGGHIRVRVDEPSYILGMVHITPNIDYTQGNDWDGQLKTMNDLHKPGLDEIGFQDLITEQMAWWDTYTANASVSYTQFSAGKQPAWLNYMTAVNKAYGNFADPTQQGFMILNRSYTPNQIVSGGGTRLQIADLTTYIDPAKFNNIFADARVDAQNFWVQIGIEAEARRKMSAKLMPNL